MNIITIIIFNKRFFIYKKVIKETKKKKNIN